MAKPFFFRCQGCERIVSVRTRKCPRCKAWTGLGHADPSVDRKLEALRTFGSFAALWTGLTACLFAIERPVPAIVVGALSALMLAAHLLVPWHEAGWRAAEIVWGVAALVCAVGLRNAGSGVALALVPAVLLGVLLITRQRFLARLRGEPAPPSAPPPSTLPARGACSSCGGRGADVVAPIYVASLITVTIREPGRFRNLCPRCARFRAFPAALASATLGWWGIPWGLIWTPQAILDNLEHGGVRLDSAELAALRAREVADGSAGAAGPLALFGGLLVLPVAMALAILPHLQAIIGR